MAKTKKRSRVGSTKWFLEDPQRANKMMQLVLSHLEEWDLHPNQFNPMDALRVIGYESEGWEAMMALQAWSNTRRNQEKQSNA